MKRFFIGTLLFSNLLFSEGFLDGLKKAVEIKSPDPYIQLFKDERKEVEREWFIENIMKKEIKNIEIVESDYTPSGNYKKGVAQILLSSGIENEFQIWEIFIENKKIAEKNVLGKVPELYNIYLPSEKVERVKEFILTYPDIEISFKNAILFWDNLPEGKNTALLVYGNGLLRFSPSSDEEKHQISIYFDKPEILNPTKWLYVRFSPSMINKNMQIIEPIKINPPPEIVKKAAEIFYEYSPLSYSIELPSFERILFTIPSSQEILIESIEGKIGEFTYNYSSLLEENITFMDRARGKILCLYSPDKKNMRIRFSSFSLWDLLHEDIYLDFEPKNEFMNVRAKLFLEAKEDGVDSLFLRLNNSLTITSISEGGNQVLFMKDNQGLITVFLFKKYRKGDKLELTINYGGKIYGETELVDIQNVVRKPSPRRIGKERKLSDELSSKLRKKDPFFLFSYTSLWHPLRTEWDFFTADVTVKVPVGFTAISNGKLFRKEGNIYYWQENVSVKYLSVVIGRFHYYEDSQSKIPIKIFASLDSGYPPIDFKKIKSILVFFSSLYREYPFEKLYIVVRQWKTLGGHSPASFIILNLLEKGLVPKSSPGDLSSVVREYFLVHEIAHQWWGNIVAGRSYRDISIPEGIAQFSTFLYIKEIYGEKIFLDIIKKVVAWINRKSGSGSIFLGTRVGHFNDDADAFLAVIYDKAALSFYLIQRLIGEETFLKSLRDVLSLYSSKDITLGELRRVIEKRAGSNLEKFFNSWFYNYTLPDVDVFWKSENTGASKNLVLRVVQKGETEFAFPLTVEWKENGEKRREELKVWYRETTFRFPVKGKIASLKVNKPKIVPGNFRVIKE
ncbi:MAG: M1 family aminopeptidase [Candidatus Aminicenantia bacterium]